MTEQLDSISRREASPATRGEKATLLLVLLLIGGALGYAVFRGSVREAAEDLKGDVRTISKGEPVDLDANAVKGKYTIYDFYADWCAPCRMLDPQLRSLAAAHDNVAIRKIDIVDWTSPVVTQHEVQDLPHMILYGPDGQMMAKGDEVYPIVSKLFSTDLF